MDTLTHSLIGAVSARAASGIRYPLHIMVTAVAAAFPDIDYLLFWLNPYQFITEWHRGISHSLVMLPLWALLLSTLFYLPLRRQISFQGLLLLCSLGLLSHILIDWITVFGTQLFAPISNQRYALGLAFDIDPWISLIVLFTLLNGFKHRVAAFVSLLLIGAYLGFLYYGQYLALQTIESKIKKENIEPNKVMVLPEPLVPWHWKLIIEHDEYYRIASLSLHPQASTWLDSLTSVIISNSRSASHPIEGIGSSHLQTSFAQHQTETNLRWKSIYKFGADIKQAQQLKEVWLHPDMLKFRQFSSLPILYRVDQTAVSSCVWFTDLRYVLPIIAPPFRYGMCRDNNKKWRLYRLKRGSHNQRERITAPQTLFSF